MVKKLLKNIYLLFFSDKKFFIILNYHRIGRVDENNPFHALHTIGIKTFKIQIKLCGFFGAFVSLNDIVESNLTSKLSFSVTFDDVSSSTKGVLSWLCKENIPVAVCPCADITTNNIGWRDKVYFINKFVDNQKIFQKLSEEFGLGKSALNDSFYRLSKSNIFNSYEMIHRIVEPLYGEIDKGDLNYISEPNYLSLKDLSQLIKSNSMLTIVNHSNSHANLATLSQIQVKDEIDMCQMFLRSNLFIDSEYFAVPFGQFTESLAQDLSKFSRPKGIKAILWVSNKVNEDHGCLPNKVRHLHRCHMPDTVSGFIKLLFKLMVLHSSTINAKVLPNSDQAFKIVENPALDDLLSFEDLSRPYKDYSGNLQFFKNFYISNPFLIKSPHTLAAVQNGRIKSLGHNLVLPHKVNGQNISINFWGNWRGLEGGNAAASAILLGKVIKSSDIVASYNPSAAIEPTFLKLKWKKVKIRSISLNPQKNSYKSFDDEFEVDSVHPETTNFNEFSNIKRFDVSLKRSFNLFNWRVNNYLLADPVYFSLVRGDESLVIIVAQFSDGRLFILDLMYNDLDALAKLVNNILLWAKNNRIKDILIESTDSMMCDFLTGKFSSKQGRDFSCYFYSRKYQSLLENSSILISPISSDTFLRGNTRCKYWMDSSSPDKSATMRKNRM